MGTNTLELVGTKPLRKCRQCGLEATNEKELDLFVKAVKSKYGRDNICGSCHSKSTRDRQIRTGWSNLPSKYNLTPEERKQMLVLQNHRCAVCNKHEYDAPKQKLHIDHCHTDGHIRGLICQQCNLGLGNFSDDPKMLLKALNYLLSEPFKLMEPKDND